MMKLIKVLGVIKFSGSVVNLLYSVFVFTIIVFGQVNNVYGESEKVGICAMTGCNCTIVAKHWINVKCIFTDYEVIIIIIIKYTKITRRLINHFFIFNFKNGL